MTKEYYSDNELDKQFTYLKQLFNNLPISTKEKLKWVEQNRNRKILSLIAIHNPALRDNLIKYSYNLTQFDTLPVSRESQSFQTLIENLNSFLQHNKNKCFIDFINLNKRESIATTLNLFSTENEINALCESSEKEFLEIQEIERKALKENTFSEKLWLSFLAFQHLIESKSNVKKNSCSFADFILKESRENLINFPSIVLDALSISKNNQQKSVYAKINTSTNYKDISFETFIEASIERIKKDISSLILYFKTIINFQKMNVDSKIRINYLIEKSFKLPSRVYENGFSTTHNLLKKICLEGGLTKEDMQKEGSLLLTELLEIDDFIIKSENNNFEWVVNVAQSSEFCKYSKFNNLKYAINKHDTIESSKSTLNKQSNFVLVEEQVLEKVI